MLPQKFPSFYHLFGAQNLVVDKTHKVLFEKAHGNNNFKSKLNKVNAYFCSSEAKLSEIQCINEVYVCKVYVKNLHFLVKILSHNRAK